MGNPASSIAPRAAAAAVLCTALLLAAPARAQQIDLSLNLLYTNPNNAAEGGAWEVIARADLQGMNTISFQLSGTNLTGLASGLPTGKVNASSAVNAGFQGFSAVRNSGVVTITAGQFQTNPDPMTADEAGAFYGVGTALANSPDYPEIGMDDTAIGPAFTTLTDVSNVPWAPGDSLGSIEWDDAVVVASGVFAPGSTPAFFALTGVQTYGSVYTSVGDSSTIGGRSTTIDTIITGIVRDNLNPLPDYNGDGVVDVADYTIWRDTLGQSVAPGAGADGDRDGMIDIDDYLAWRDNFGAVVSGAASSSAPVSATPAPEPSGALITAITALMAGGIRRQKTGIFGMQGVFCKKHEYREKLLDTPETPSHNAAS